MPATLLIARVAARGTWKEGVLRLPQADIEALQAQVKATDVQVATRPTLAISGKVQAKLPGTSAQADGKLAARLGAGTLQVQSASAQQTLAWLRTLPGLTQLAPGLAARGRPSLNDPVPHTNSTPPPAAPAHRPRGR